MEIGLLTGDRGTSMQDGACGLTAGDHQDSFTVVRGRDLTKRKSRRQI